MTRPHTAMRALVLALLLPACQRGGDADPAREPPPEIHQAYARDLDKLCDVVARSGGGELVGGDRQLAIANWLAANLETPESRKFLAYIQPLAGEAKAQALEAEAKAVGLPGCALAAEWR